MSVTNSAAKPSGDDQLMALDWTSLGLLVRRGALDAVAMHFAALGAEDAGLADEDAGLMDETVELAARNCDAESSATGASDE